MTFIFPLLSIDIIYIHQYVWLWGNFGMFYYGIFSPIILIFLNYFIGILGINIYFLHNTLKLRKEVKNLMQMTAGWVRWGVIIILCYSIWLLFFIIYYFNFVPPSLTFSIQLTAILPYISGGLLIIAGYIISRKADVETEKKI